MRPLKQNRDSSADLAQEADLVMEKSHLLPPLHEGERRKTYSNYLSQLLGGEEGKREIR
jgi:hypothetical protein